MANLNIFCVIEGETKSFSVDIERTKTVDHLKKAIKADQSPDLDHINPKNLTLWRVSIPDDDKLPALLASFTEEQNLLNFLSDKLKLRPTMKISSVFDAKLPEETIHVFVQLPQSGNACSMQAFRIHVIQVPFLFP